MTRKYFKMNFSIFHLFFLVQSGYGYPENWMTIWVPRSLGRNSEAFFWLPPLLWGSLHGSLGKELWNLLLLNHKYTMLVATSNFEGTEMFPLTSETRSMPGNFTGGMCIQPTFLSDSFDTHSPVVPLDLALHWTFWGGPNHLGSQFCGSNCPSIPRNWQLLSNMGCVQPVKMSKATNSVKYLTLYIMCARMCTLFGMHVYSIYWNWINLLEAWFQKRRHWAIVSSQHQDKYVDKFYIYVYVYIYYII